MIRPPAVAGRFYPGERVQLQRTLDELLSSDAQKAPARACIVPHAGYVYSGRVASAVYAALKLPPRLILLGPRHYPRGERLAIVSEGTWQTPLGDARVDSPLAAEIKGAFPVIREDSVAHASEHSLEVQIPFLQCLAPEFTFVPIVLGTDRLDALESLGHALANVVHQHDGEVMIITSSDMNHYESDAITRVKDRKAIDAILALDGRRLYNTVRNESISMCGYAAAVAMLTAACDLHAQKAELIAYATSGEVNGDFDSVVGYAGIVVQ